MGTQLFRLFGFLSLAFFINACAVDESQLATSYSELKKDKKEKKDKKPKKDKKDKVRDSFEQLPVGTDAPESMAFMASGSGYAFVTDETAAHGDHSLAFGITEDSPDPDRMGLRLCLDEPSAEYIRASFSVRFENFINWNGIGISSESGWLYWWWARENGTLFDDVTFHTLLPGVWHDIIVEIDRVSGMASIFVDGYAHSAPIDGPWYYIDHSVPMQCVFVFAGIRENVQKAFLDDVMVTDKRI